MNAPITFGHPTIEYPDSDGKPMAENTKQYEWIVTIKGNLDIVFRNHPEVFVAGDNLIYAQLGDPRVHQAPVIYVAFGRPKGHRGSYKVWDEGGIFPRSYSRFSPPATAARRWRGSSSSTRSTGPKNSTSTTRTRMSWADDVERMVSWRRSPR